MTCHGQRRALIGSNNCTELGASAKGKKVARLREIAAEIEAVKKRHRSDVRREAKEAIERLAKLDESDLKTLLSRYKV